MDLTATLDTPAHPPEAVFPWVADLERYPRWLEIVPRAVVDGDAADGRAAWLVDLRGRLGPLARSKRLRMARVSCEAPCAVRFERDEEDGRDHSTWVLEAEVRPWDGGSRLTMRLHYGGSLLVAGVERLLRNEIERSGPRLLACLSEGLGPSTGPPAG